MIKTVIKLLVIYLTAFQFLLMPLAEVKAQLDSVAGLDTSSIGQSAGDSISGLSDTIGLSSKISDEDFEKIKECGKFDEINEDEYQKFENQINSRIANCSSESGQPSGIGKMLGGFKMPETFQRLTPILLGVFSAIESASNYAIMKQGLTCQAPSGQIMFAVNALGFALDLINFVIYIVKFVKILSLLEEKIQTTTAYGRENWTEEDKFFHERQQKINEEKYGPESKRFQEYKVYLDRLAEILDLEILYATLNLVGLVLNVIGAVIGLGLALAEMAVPALTSLYMCTPQPMASLLNDNPVFEEKSFEDFLSKPEKYYASKKTLFGKVIGGLTAFTVRNAFAQGKDTGVTNKKKVTVILDFISETDGTKKNTIFYKEAKGNKADENNKVVNISFTEDELQSSDIGKIIKERVRSKVGTIDINTDYKINIVGHGAPNLDYVLVEAPGGKLNFVSSSSIAEGLADFNERQNAHIKMMTCSSGVCSIDNDNSGSFVESLATKLRLKVSGATASIFLDKDTVYRVYTLDFDEDNKLYNTRMLTTDEEPPWGKIVGILENGKAQRVYPNDDYFMALYKIKNDLSLSIEKRKQVTILLNDYRDRLDARSAIVNDLQKKYDQASVTSKKERTVVFAMEAAVNGQIDIVRERMLNFLIDNLPGEEYLKDAPELKKRLANKGKVGKGEFLKKNKARLEKYKKLSKSKIATASAETEISRIYAEEVVKRFTDASNKMYLDYMDNLQRSGKNSSVSNYNNKYKNLAKALTRDREWILTQGAEVAEVDRALTIIKENAKLNIAENKWPKRVNGLDQKTIDLIDAQSEDPWRGAKVTSDGIDFPNDDVYQKLKNLGQSPSLRKRALALAYMAQYQDIYLKRVRKIQEGRGYNFRREESYGRNYSLLVETDLGNDFDKFRKVILTEYKRVTDGKEAAKLTDSENESFRNARSRRLARLQREFSGPEAIKKMFASPNAKQADNAIRTVRNRMLSSLGIDSGTSRKGQSNVKSDIVNSKKPYTIILNTTNTNDPSFATFDAYNKNKTSRANTLVIDVGHKKPAEVAAYIKTVIEKETAGKSKVPLQDYLNSDEGARLRVVIQGSETSDGDSLVTKWSRGGGINKDQSGKKSFKVDDLAEGLSPLKKALSKSNTRASLMVSDDASFGVLNSKEAATKRLAKTLGAKTKSTGLRTVFSLEDHNTFSKVVRLDFDDSGIIRNNPFSYEDEPVWGKVFIDAKGAVSVEGDSAYTQAKKLLKDPRVSSETKTKLRSLITEYHKKLSMRSQIIGDSLETIKRRTAEGNPIKKNSSDAKGLLIRDIGSRQDIELTRRKIFDALNIEVNRSDSSLSKGRKDKIAKIIQNGKSDVERKIESIDIEKQSKLKTGVGTDSDDFVKGYYREVDDFFKLASSKIDTESRTRKARTENRKKMVYLMEVYDDGKNGAINKRRNSMVAKVTSDKTSSGSKKKSRGIKEEAKKSKNEGKRRTPKAVVDDNKAIRRNEVPYDTLSLNPLNTEIDSDSARPKSLTTKKKVIVILDFISEADPGKEETTLYQGIKENKDRNNNDVVKFSFTDDELQDPNIGELIKKKVRSEVGRFSSDTDYKIVIDGHGRASGDGVSSKGADGETRHISVGSIAEGLTDFNGRDNVHVKMITCSAGACTIDSDGSDSLVQNLSRELKLKVAGASATLFLDEGNVYRVYTFDYDEENEIYLLRTLTANEEPPWGKSVGITEKLKLFRKVKDVTSRIYPNDDYFMALHEVIKDSTLTRAQKRQATDLLNAYRKRIDVRSFVMSDLNKKYGHVKSKNDIERARVFAMEANLNGQIDDVRHKMLNFLIENPPNETYLDGKSDLKRRMADGGKEGKSEFEANNEARLKKYKRLSGSKTKVTDVEAEITRIYAPEIVKLFAEANNKIYLDHVYDLYYSGEDSSPEEYSEKYGRLALNLKEEVELIKAHGGGDDLDKIGVSKILEIIEANSQSDAVKGKWPRSTNPIDQATIDLVDGKSEDPWRGAKVTSEGIDFPNDDIYQKLKALSQNSDLETRARGLASMAEYQEAYVRRLQKIQGEDLGSDHGLLSQAHRDNKFDNIRKEFLIDYKEATVGEDKAKLTKLEKREFIKSKLRRMKKLGRNLSTETKVGVQLSDLNTFEDNVRDARKNVRDRSGVSLGETDGGQEIVAKVVKQKGSKKGRPYTIILNAIHKEDPSFEGFYAHIKDKLLRRNLDNVFIIDVSEIKPNDMKAYIRTTLERKMVVESSSPEAKKIPLKQLLEAEGAPELRIVVQGKETSDGKSLVTKWDTGGINEDMAMERVYKIDDLVEGLGPLKSVLRKESTKASFVFDDNASSGSEKSKKMATKKLAKALGVETRRKNLSTIGAEAIGDDSNNRLVALGEEGFDVTSKRKPAAFGVDDSGVSSKAKKARKAATKSTDSSSKPKNFTVAEGLPKPLTSGSESDGNSVADRTKAQPGPDDGVDVDDAFKPVITSDTDTDGGDIEAIKKPQGASNTDQIIQKAGMGIGAGNLLLSLATLVLDFLLSARRGQPDYTTFAIGLATWAIGAFMMLAPLIGASVISKIGNFIAHPIFRAAMNGFTIVLSAILMVSMLQAIGELTKRNRIVKRIRDLYQSMTGGATAMTKINHRKRLNLGQIMKEGIEIIFGIKNVKAQKRIDESFKFCLNHRGQIDMKCHCRKKNRCLRFPKKYIPKALLKNKDIRKYLYTFDNLSFGKIGIEDLNPAKMRKVMVGAYNHGMKFNRLVKNKIKKNKKTRNRLKKLSRASKILNRDFISRMSKNDLSFINRYHNVLSPQLAVKLAMDDVRSNSRLNVSLFSRSIDKQVMFMPKKEILKSTRSIKKSFQGRQNSKDNSLSMIKRNLASVFSTKNAEKGKSTLKANPGIHEKESNIFELISKRMLKKYFIIDVR